MSNLEDRRVSFVSTKSTDQGKPADPPESRKSSMSRSDGKDKKKKGRKGSHSPKGSPKSSFGRRGSRRGSMKPKKVTEDVTTSNQARKDSLFKKSDVKYKEIRRALTKRQREAKKQAESGEKPTQEL